MIVTHSWIDLSQAQHRHILEEMSASFQKPFASTASSTAILRFSRPSCRVHFFFLDTSYPISTWSAIAITWIQDGVIYLDKFFLRSSQRQQGQGRLFLNEWLSLYNNLRPIVWRTDHILATRFYGKHPDVRTFAIQGSYVYQTVGQQSWNDPALSSISQMPSAFITRRE